MILTRSCGVKAMSVMYRTPFSEFLKTRNMKFVKNLVPIPNLHKTYLEFHLKELDIGPKPFKVFEAFAFK